MKLRVVFLCGESLRWQTAAVPGSSLPGAGAGAEMDVSFMNMNGYTERKMSSRPLFKIAVFIYFNGFSLYLSITDGSLLPKDIFTPVHTACMLMHVICMHVPHSCIST